MHLLALAAGALIGGSAAAQSDTVKIGVILPMTGPSASTGRQIDAAIKLFLAQNGAKVVVLGLTFKEDCPDLRNSRVADIIAELREYHCEVSVHDPLADTDDARHEYGIELTPWEALPKAHAVILAVAHKQYRTLSAADFKALMSNPAVLMDVKSVVDRAALDGNGIEIWRL